MGRVVADIRNRLVGWDEQQISESVSSFVDAMDNIDDAEGDKKEQLAEQGKQALVTLATGLLTDIHRIANAMSAAAPTEADAIAPPWSAFAYEHLPAHLQAISKPIGDLARAMDELLPDGPEKAVGLRKLLEAKDSLVRARV
jgi:hypothetical protein